MAFSTFEEAVSEKPEVGGVLDVEADVFETPNVKADFGDSREVVNEDVSPGLDARPKGNCVGAELVGGMNGGNVKPPVFVPLSPVEASLGDASAGVPNGFGMENKEVVFSGGVLPPKREAELVGTEPRIVNGCEDPSNSD